MKGGDSGQWIWCYPTAPSVRRLGLVGGNEGVDWIEMGAQMEDNYQFSPCSSWGQRRRGMQGDWWVDQELSSGVGVEVGRG